METDCTTILADETKVVIGSAPFALYTRDNVAAGFTVNFCYFCSVESTNGSYFTFDKVISV